MEPTEITDQVVKCATDRMDRTKQAGQAVAARYDTALGRIVVDLNTGRQLAFSVDLAEGLAGASPADLTVIEITPSGLGLHWPKLDADVYLPPLLNATAKRQKKPA